MDIHITGTNNTHAQGQGAPDTRSSRQSEFSFKLQSIEGFSRAWSVGKQRNWLLPDSSEEENLRRGGESGAVWQSAEGCEAAGLRGCGAPAPAPSSPGPRECAGPRGGVSRVSPARDRPHPRTWLHRSKGGRGRSARPGRRGRSRAPPPPYCALHTAAWEGGGVTDSSLCLPAPSFQTSSACTEAAAGET